MPDYKTLLDTLLPLGDNKVFIPGLVKQLQSDIGLVPFVGAGVSVPYHYPDWGGFLVSLAPDQESKAAVNKLLAGMEYEKAAEYILQKRGADTFQLMFSNAFDHVIDATKDTAVAKLAKFPRGPIITTNFDRVVETVLRARGCSIEVIDGANVDKVREAFQYHTNSLLKLHGDADNRTNRVLTFTDYEKHYSGSVKTVLQNVITRSLLFIGCSLKSDRTVEIIRQSKVAGQVRHFAILALPSIPEEFSERSYMLSEELGINVIWYPSGKHEYIQELLSYLGDSVPPERRRNGKTHGTPVHNNIPAAPFQLFGRATQLMDLQVALSKFPVIVVEGNRGVGKTAFALHGFRELLQSESFGALIWITASARKDQLQLSHILDEISRTIDYPFTVQTVTEKEQILSKELNLRNIQCLLLLDNYETIADPEIGLFLFQRLPPKLTVLITATGRIIREDPNKPGTLITPTGDIETAAPVRIKKIFLEELPKGEALLLFNGLAGMNGMVKEPDKDLDRLYDVVGGNPLALKWIVGQMSGGKELPKILDLLREGKATILREIFLQSWDELDNCTQVVLCSTAVFVIPCLQQALQAASGLSTDEFETALEQLTRLYLLNRLRLHDTSATLQENDSTRFFIHPFTRDFAELQKEHMGAADIYLRAAEFYIQYITDRAGSTDKEEAQSQEELNAERLNILAVLNECLKRGYVVQLVTLVQIMSRWLFIESHWTDLETWGEMAIKVSGNNINHKAIARISNELGRLYSHQSKYKKADAAFTEALQHAFSADPPDRWAIAYIHHHQGEALLRRNNPGDAKLLLEDSLREFEEIGSRREVIGVRYRLAVAYFELEKYEEAKIRFTQGISDTIEENWPRLEGFNRRYLGELAVLDDKLVEARYQFERSLALVSASDMRIQALTELSFARLEYKAKHSDKALEKATAARDHFTKIRMLKEAEEAERLIMNVRENKT